MKVSLWAPVAVMICVILKMTLVVYQCHSSEVF